MPVHPAKGQLDYTSGTSELNAQSFLIEQIINRIQTATLVKIITVTNEGDISPVGFVSVKPMVNQMTGDRRSVEHGIIYNIPYFRLQGGADAIIIDPKVGDIGICLFCSRDISVVKNTKKQGNPGSYRKFAMADGLYIGGVLNGVPTQYIAYSEQGITVTSPTKVIINAPQIDLNGNFKVTGNTVFDGTVIANDHIIDERHKHVNSGGTGLGGIVQ
jgi:hypothetical protein